MATDLVSIVYRQPERTKYRDGATALPPDRLLLRRLLRVALQIVMYRIVDIEKHPLTAQSGAEG